jgi:hypothetical protein
MLLAGSAALAGCAIVMDENATSIENSAALHAEGPLKLNPRPASRDTNKVRKTRIENNDRFMMGSICCFVLVYISEVLLEVFIPALSRGFQSWSPGSWLSDSIAMGTSCVAAWLTAQ